MLKTNLSVRYYDTVLTGVFKEIIFEVLLKQVILLPV